MTRHDLMKWILDTHDIGVVLANSATEGQDGRIEVDAKALKSFALQLRMLKESAKDGVAAELSIEDGVRKPIFVIGREGNC